MTVIAIAVYAAIVWHVGKLVERRGNTLLGKRLQTICIMSVMCGFMGVIVAAVGITALLGGYEHPAALVVHYIGGGVGFVWGCILGWRDPQMN